MTAFTTAAFADIVSFTRASSGTYWGQNGTLATAASGEHRLEWGAGSLLSGLSVQRRTLTLDKGIYSLTMTGTGSVAVRIGSRIVATATSATRRWVQVRADDTDVELTPLGSVTAWDMRKSLGLLIEPARTNLAIRSQEFDNDVAWVKARATVSANTTAAPDGTLTADSLIEDSTSANTHLITAGDINVTSGVAYTTSIFAKSNTRSQITILHSSPGLPVGQVLFDLNAGTASVFSGSVSAYSITEIHSGWYLCSITSVATGTSNAAVQVRLASGGTPSYDGDGSSGVYIWGAQFEAGTYASSYTATEGSQITRPADVATVIDADDYYAAAGNTLTITATAAAGLGTQVLAQWDDGTEDERVRVLRDSSGDLRVIVTAGGAEQANLDLGAVANGAAFTVSLRWQANGFAASLNGAAEVTDASGSLPAGITTLRIGADSAGNQWGGHIASVVPRPRYFSETQNESMAA